LTSVTAIRYIYNILLTITGGYMAKITQYIPSFFGNTLIPCVENFDTQCELLEIPFVKNFRISVNGKPDRYFLRYSLHNNNILMVETCYGYSFIIGFIIGHHNLTLPKWGSDEENTDKCQNSFNLTQ
jgi:hypothetical protein